MEVSRDNEEFVRLYALHERQLRRYVTAMVPVAADVDDILQETAVALMRKFEQYDREQPFFNWACRFAVYEVLQHRKRNATRSRHFSQAVVEMIAAEYQQHQQAADRRRQLLAECVRQLEEQDRRLIELRYGGTETVDQLAQRINEPAARLYRSLARIRKLLASCVRSKLAVEALP